MMEEVNEQAIIDMINNIPKGLSPVERMVLYNHGTVQTLLSVLFEAPVRVEILDQKVISNNTIARWSRLVAGNFAGLQTHLESKTTVCYAQSIITSDNKGFMVGIKEKNMGIGQLISAKCIETRRRIINLYSDSSIFSRIYAIESVGMVASGNNLSCLITEIFPKQTFKDIIT